MVVYLGYIAAGILGTVAVTSASFAIGAVLGLPLAWARRSRSAAVRLVTGGVIDILRTVPNLVWLFLVFFGLPQVGVRLDPWTAAILALGVSSAAYMAEVYRGGFAAVGKGQWLASSALGLGSWDRTRYVILPQVVRVVVPTMATYAISLLKESALASTIGVAGAHLSRRNRDTADG